MGCFLRRTRLIPDSSNLWKLKDVALCSSRYAMDEARINLADEDERRRLTRLSEVIHLLEAGPGTIPRGISSPEKDVPILLAAIESRAIHLLMGDVRHLLGPEGTRD
jgi:hypothetical protein